ncbi:SIR2 family NAD-dependent protein deacylase [Alkaliphilus serpentinus]|uniref:protein acetyllysine N-acetyltransferase n=1 Tax=Alkaliphilus serpentinus TaxID=1482731 RepID=A0A833M6Q2_9FIRM|nr:Sir2 family NAD-dependent protein deacetylase [Alkaliphilus serpentinus]KAB3528844.1 transcriptional regulator [Alkaliphilus serpentinus]
MKRIVAFTGAGVSKASGIPTFNEMGELRNLLTRDYFNENPNHFYKILKELHSTIKGAKPNGAHLALAKHNIPIVTMNIDSLHEKAGSKRVIEIHGNLNSIFCPKCLRSYDLEGVNEKIYCTHCDTLLQPKVVLYGDEIPLYFEAISMVSEADVLLVVGTSFYTSTAHDLVYRAERMGIEVKLINRDAEVEVPQYLAKILG